MKIVNRLAVIAVVTVLMQALATISTNAGPANTARLALDGIGSIRVGMTIAEAEKASGMRLYEPGRFRASEGCYYVLPRDASRKLAFMVFSGSSSQQMNRSADRIVRVDISDDSRITTLSGVGIGTSAAQVKATYAGKIEESPHPYTGRDGGKYLTYQPRHLADKRYSLIFETDKGKVVRFRSGFKDAVAQIEGCA